MKYKFPRRIICLAAFIQEMNTIAKQNIHNALYILCKDRNDIYCFVIINNSPFSFQADEDLRFLIQKGIVVENQGLLSVQSQERFAKKLDMFAKVAIQELKNTNNFVVEPIYQQHPLNEPGFFTIGYEGIDIDQYINKLKENSIPLLCDVRKNAFSQKYGFSKSEMQNALNQCGIEYMHMPELGISSEERNNSQSIPKLLQEYYENIKLYGIEHTEKLVQLYKKYQKLAITCFESKYTCCHRGKISKILQEQYNIEVRHL